MTGLTDQNITYTFHCRCGSDGFERPERSMEPMAFHEGYFICSNCKKMHDFRSSAFMKTYTRLGLF